MLNIKITSTSGSWTLKDTIPENYSFKEWVNIKSVVECLFKNILLIAIDNNKSTDLTISIDKV
jgi:hypothetical protein